MKDEVTTNDLLEFMQKNMATKEDLNVLEHRLLDSVDEKNADLKGDLTIMLCGEDKKVVKLINILHGKQVISDNEADSLLEMRPFPQV